MALTVVTWNVQGLARPDVTGLADHLREVGADVVFLQEIQHRQAARLADQLDARSLTWSFKHWRPPLPREGLATIGVTQELDATTTAVTRPRRPWSWRRRIIQRTAVALGDRRLAVVHAHLSPHRSGADRRTSEVRAILGDGTPDVVVGDLNERPGEPALAALASAGLADAWESATERRGPGPTSFGSGKGRPADQRLDHVLVGPAVAVRRAEVPDTTGDDRARWAALSDHLPLTVVLVPAAAS